MILHGVAHSFIELDKAVVHVIRLVGFLWLWFSVMCSFLWLWFSSKDGNNKGQKWYGPNIPGSYAVLLFTTSDFTPITHHTHNWMLFLLWLHCFIFSGVISPLISSSILGTYWPGVFIFQCLIFLPFHTVHGVLKARILMWFAILFSSGPRFVRTLHHDLSVLGGPTWRGS